MLAGIALLGVVTAAIAAWLVNEVRVVDEVAQTATRGDIAQLRADIAELRAALGVESDSASPSI
jgi:voltage-gated potassium channel